MLQENILKEAPRLNKKKRLTSVIPRILRSKRRILRSPMPNEHHAPRVGLCLSLRPIVLYFL